MGFLFVLWLISYYLIVIELKTASDYTITKVIKMRIAFLSLELVKHEEIFRKDDLLANVDKFKNNLNSNFERELQENGAVYVCGYLAMLFYLPRYLSCHCKKCQRTYCVIELLILGFIA